MTHKPFFDFGLSQAMGNKFGGGNRLITKPNLQATRAAKPTHFTLSNQSVFGYVTAATENNITQLQFVLRQAINIRLVDSGDAIFNNAAIANIGWHDNRNPYLLVV